MKNLYDLELENVIREIKKNKAKSVLIQLPEGLKPQALEIVNEVEKKTKTKCIIWLDTCYGACDIPNVTEIDLLVQFGHSDYL